MSGNVSANLSAGAQRTVVACRPIAGTYGAEQRFFQRFGSIRRFEPPDAAGEGCWHGCCNSPFTDRQQVCGGQEQDMRQSILRGVGLLACLPALATDANPSALPAEGSHLNQLLTGHDARYDMCAYRRLPLQCASKLHGV